MARVANIRGMLLEEAVLHLLRHSGYRAVETAEGDPTLEAGHSGLEVKGRGTNHQIDAIADFGVHQPFSNPQRLLVEAKFYAPGTKVGLPVVREAVGVLKDVSEFWVIGDDQVVPKGRYHYQYAVLSATGYTPQAQRYAFVQDVYLIPFAESAYFRPIIDAIRGVIAPPQFRGSNPDLPIQLGVLRGRVRKAIRGEAAEDEWILEQVPELLGPVRNVVATCQEIRFGLLAVLGGRFPVFLIPDRRLRDAALEEEYSVRIFRGDGDETWYLRDSRTDIPLFSFDLPRELFLMYAEHHMLRADAALDLKEQQLSEFQAISVQNRTVRLINFRLDREWVGEIRGRLEGPRQ